MFNENANDYLFPCRATVWPDFLHRSGLAAPCGHRDFGSGKFIRVKAKPGNHRKAVQLVESVRGGKTVRKRLDQGLAAPAYARRESRARLLEPYEGYLASKNGDCPGLSRRRLFREIQERGYEGSYTVGRIISARSGWMRRPARAGRPCGADSSLDRARKPPERGSCERQGTCRILK